MTFLRILLATALVCSLSATAQETAETPLEEVDTASAWFKEADGLYEAAKSQAQASGDPNLAYRYFSACIPLFQRFANTYPKDENAPKAIYRSGVSYLLTGRREQAESSFSTTLHITKRRGPTAAAAAFRLGSLAYNDKYFKTALPHFSLAASQTDNPVIRHKALNYEARCLLIDERISDAKKVLRELVNDPVEPNEFKNQASLALAHIAATSDQFEEAFELYQNIANSDSTEEGFLAIKAQAIVHGGMTAMRLGKTEEGLGMLTAALKNPTLPGDAKGEAQLMLMQHEFAAGDFQKVQDLFRYNSTGSSVRADTAAEIFLYAGRASAKLGQHNAAVEAFVMVDRSAPNTKMAFEASFRRLLSFYEMRSTNVPESVNAFVELYKNKYSSSPWIQQARVMKAETYFTFADYENATKAWELVDFSRLPEQMQGPAYFKSGWSLVENGDYNSAISYLSEFISRYPDSPDIYGAIAKRAESYLEVGDRISALADCERILANKPKTPLAAFALQLSGRLYRLERENDKMLESYQTLLADYNNLSQDTIARANYNMGLGYFDKGEFETAITHLNKSKSIVPEFYEEPANTTIALCYYRLKEADALRETVSRLYSLNPNKVLPRRLLVWLGLRMYEQSNYPAADLYLSIVEGTDETQEQETEIGIWKALAKSRLEVPGQAERALLAIDAILAVEDDPFWRCDAFLDKANALILLERWNEAEIAVSRGLDLDPQGTVKAGLHLAFGDIALAFGQFSDAASSYVRAAEFFLNDSTIQPIALYKAAWCFQQVGNHDAARAFEERLRLDHPQWKAPAEFNVKPGSANIQSITAEVVPVDAEEPPVAEPKPLPSGVISISN